MSEEYVGSEEIEGTFAPVRLGQAIVPFFELAGIAAEIAPACESPIEVELGAQLIRALKGSSFRVVPQFKWLRYRMDFAIVENGKPLIFVECDGKEFHSTPAQLENDRKKDQAAKLAGIPLMRFSGSDIFRNALACAKLTVQHVHAR